MWQNWCGLLGSFLSDLLLQAFGLSVWLLVPLLFRAAGLVFTGRKTEWSQLKLVWGFFLLLVVSGLLATYWPEKTIYQNQISLGGVLGTGFRKLLIPAFNNVGVQLVFWFLAAILLVFVSDKSLKELMAIPLSFLKKAAGLPWKSWLESFSLPPLSSEKNKKPASPAASSSRRAPRLGPFR